MRYRIAQKGSKLTVSIEDGSEVIASALAKDMKEAVALRDAAAKDGPDALKAKK